MSRVIRYLSHPQVKIDPTVDVRSWSLNAVGRARVSALIEANVFEGTQTVISSDEAKAVETATPIANALRCPLVTRPAMHENDRSATGFLPPQEFEAVADAFFAQPDVSVRGWETARAAQARIVAEVEASRQLYPSGDLLFVGHGGVGTLLYCHLAGVPISRAHDQGGGGGGCYFVFSDPNGKPEHPWHPMEELLPTR